MSIVVKDAALLRERDERREEVLNLAERLFRLYDGGFKHDRSVTKSGIVAAVINTLPVHIHYVISSRDEVKKFDGKSVPGSSYVFVVNLRYCGERFARVIKNKKNFPLITPFISKKFSHASERYVYHTPDYDPTAVLPTVAQRIRGDYPNTFSWDTTFHRFAELFRHDDLSLYLYLEKDELANLEALLDNVDNVMVKERGKRSKIFDSPESIASYIQRQGQ